MSSQIENPALDQGEPPAPLKFDRRRCDRHCTEGIATAFRLNGDRFGQIHDLTLLDRSPGGLGAICDQAIEPGTVVSVGFAQPGQLARRGCVVRCIPCGQGYRIAIQFQMGLAA